MNEDLKKFTTVNVITAILVMDALSIILYAYPNHPQYFKIQIIYTLVSLYGLIVQGVFIYKFHWEGLKNFFKNLGYEKRKEN